MCFDMDFDGDKKVRVRYGVVSPIEAVVQL